MRFSYRLRQANGKDLRGCLEAKDEQEARQRLLNREGVLLKLNPTVEWPFKPRSLQIRHKLHGVIRQLALMSGANLPLRESLALVVTQQKHEAARQVLEDVYRQVCQGSPLSVALSQQPRFFDALCCATLAAGEHSGDLGGAMKNYADYRDEQHRLHQALRQAVSYPLFLLVMSCLVITILLTVAVPQIVSQLTLSGVALPWSTRLVLGLSDLIQTALLPLLIVVMIGGMFMFYMLKYNWWREWLDAQFLGIPVIGKLILRIQQVRLLMTLGILCQSAVPMVDGLRLACDALSNRNFRSIMQLVTHRLVEGEGFSVALTKSGLFPPDVLALLHAGEQGGRLSQTLNYVASLQREALQLKLLGLVKLIEPLLIILLGLIVLLVFMAIIQPMLTMNSLAL